MRQLLFVFATGLVLLAATSHTHAGDGCELFGEVSVEAVRVGSINVCTLTKNPVACAIAGVLTTSAGNGLVKKATVGACEYIVEKYDDHFKVTIKADAKNAAAATKAFEEMKKCKEFKVKEKK